MVSPNLASLRGAVGGEESEEGGVGPVAGADELQAPGPGGVDQVALRELGDAARWSGLPSRAGREKAGAAVARSSSASIAPAARSTLPPKCCTALLTATAAMATSAKATNASFSQRGTTQVRRAALGMLE